MEPRDLDAIGIIAFNGIIKNALRLHPDGKHLLYPMGRKVVIRNIETSEQRFLNGHTNNVSALCVSPCGEYVASGQNNHLGFKAMVIVWDYKESAMRGSYETHKVSVADLCFTCNSDFLVSLGGRDDGNVIVWDVRNNSPICGSYASNDTSGNAYEIARMHVHGERFITAGDRTLKIWRVDASKRKVHGVDVEVGKLKRFINCIVVDERDEIVYCGTSSGDVIKARLNLPDELQRGESTRPPVMIGCYSKMTRDLRKMKAGEGDLYAGGVKCLLLLKDGKLMLGAGDGAVELIEIINKTTSRTQKLSKLPNTPQIFTHRAENVCSTVTSIVLYLNDFVLVGTTWCEIYQIQLSNFHMRLLITSHTSCIYSIAFPRDDSEIFATGGKNDVRLWQLKTHKEALRITVPNFVCSSLHFARGNQMLFSAWNDGTIRAFAPHNGQLYFAIHNAHTKAVSTVAVASDAATLISGGCDGQVRVWEIKDDVQRLISVLKEHRGPITSLHISHNNEDLISSSTDGTCVVWDIIRCVRKHVLMGNTMFMMAQFTPDGIQILTCGTDRKIAYWETLDCSLVREVEGSSVGTLNCIDISSDGRCFVTGSSDSTVKIWEYDSADSTHVGVSHAAIISACKFSPDGKHVVTASADGEIIIWKYSSESSEDSKSTVQTGRTASSTRRSRNGDSDKLSLRKAEGDGDAAADETTRSIKKSASSCTSDQKRLSAASDRSKGSKKEVQEERMSVCRSVRSANSKSNAVALNSCRCNDSKSDSSSSKAREMDKSKEASDLYSRRSITSNT
ncbi:cilia- and flagella-associated protein 52 [Linepithema humile]|uniref:cilia- and flagella-associated protein 52 n=1 Tax=Linepithema humile TaxID=83485 RepID=UPI000623A0BA|nr:PREDICTED: cilia- and flagella-associated protein 52 [Linepithema humile]XP_012220706.1 PREDICTED: cilia- and flagella-associated protein 52 [Linepithema humile]XP_012220707.1 PREDICTED: cilia- and flagella-associated protein 52 [Linepithema humile]